MLLIHTIRYRLARALNIVAYLKAENFALRHQRIVQLPRVGGFTIDMSGKKMLDFLRFKLCEGQGYSKIGTWNEQVRWRRRQGIHSYKSKREVNRRMSDDDENKVRQRLMSIELGLAKRTVQGSN